MPTLTFLWRHCWQEGKRGYLVAAREGAPIPCCWVESIILLKGFWIIILVHYRNKFDWESSGEGAGVALKSCLGKDKQNAGAKEMAGEGVQDPECQLRILTVQEWKTILDSWKSRNLQSHRFSLQVMLFLFFLPKCHLC